MLAPDRKLLDKVDYPILTQMTEERLNTAFANRFRCPESYARYSLAGKLEGPNRFFCFGEDTVCYGQTSTGNSTSEHSNLHDISESIRFEDSRCVLPFDPSQVVDDLRHENYVSDRLHPQGWGDPGSDGERNHLAAWIRNAYYFFRPCLPVLVRRHLQRIALRGWKRRRFPAWPVDRTVEHLFEEFLKLSSRASRTETIPFIWFWPEGHSSCLIMTHDVETQKGLEFCPVLMDMDESCGMRSSFQIIPEGRYRASDTAIDAIQARGFEINVHDLNHDGHLFRSRDEFLRRVPRINEYAEEIGAKGFRSAVLFRNLDWYNSFAFSYDMSVPNVGHLDPQPGGCCTVMPYFVGNIVELPLTTTQDYSLFHILGDYSLDLWRRQVGMISEKHGLISFNIHPDYIMSQPARSTYQGLLAHLSRLCAETRIWRALPGEVDFWWRQRQQMSLVQEGKTWRIEGPGRDRARIAWATVTGEQVSYSF